MEINWTIEQELEAKNLLEEALDLKLKAYMRKSRFMPAEEREHHRAYFRRIQLIINALVIST